MGNGKPEPKVKAMDTAPETKGSHVLQEVVQMTGLSHEYLDSEISSFLGAEGASVNDMTLPQLRSVLLSYLEMVNEEMTQLTEKH